MKHALLVVAFAALAGCSFDLYADPEGLQCDTGGVCPNGYVCVTGNVCHTTQGSGGGSGGSGGAGGTAAGGGTGGSAAGGGTGGTGGAAGGGAGGGSGGGAGGGSGGAGGGTNPCMGISCTNPPAPGCKDAMTLTTFSNSGTCNNGQCSYTSTDTPCMNGCANNACQNQNLCTGNMCLSPPPPTCMGTSVRTFMAPGICAPGTGLCAYNPIDTPCGNLGCSGGVCITPPQVVSQTMPRLKFAVNGIDQAPGSSGAHVVAVGDNGTVFKWDGMTWARITGVSATTANLNTVWFSGANSALLAGSQRTIARYNGTTFSLVPNVPGSATANFTQIHGRDEQTFTLIDGSDYFWRFDGAAPAATQWKNGAIGSTPLTNSYKTAGVYVDASNRARVVGTVTTLVGAASNGITFYFNASGCSPCEDVDTTSTDGYGAVGGPATDGGALMPDSAIVGRATSSGVRHHNVNSPYYDSTFNPALSLPSSEGIAAISAGSATRQTYFLTRSTAGTVGHLYRYSGSTGLDPNALGDFYFDKASMSRTEAGGVIVAETDTTNAVNNIYRRNAISGEMLDLGESWTAAGGNGAGLVLASGFGDLAFRATGSPTWQFRRGPFVSVTDIAAQNGPSGVLVVGKAGKLERFALGATSPTITAIPSGTTTLDFNGVCRVSDVEAYAVGNSGTIRSVNTLNATSAAMTSGTTKNLLAVDCPSASNAVACGQGGALLRLQAGAWTAISPAFPTATADLTSCRVVGNVLWVAGDGVFAKLDLGAANPVWQMLATQPRLSRLLVFSASDVYAISGNKSVVRFDGGGWNTLFTATSGTLVGGGQVGGKVVYAGSLGVVVEGQ